jgi:hypothetical protein
MAEVRIKAERGDKAGAGRVDRWLSRAVNWAAVKGGKSWGLEELALKKGQRAFVVSVTARVASGAGKVLAVLPDRKQQTVRQFLAGRPKRLTRALRTVCTALYEGFLQAVKEV